MQTEDAASNGLVPVAQSAAKAWKEAHASWASRVPATAWERAFAAEAYHAVGDARTASQLVRGIVLPSAATPWFEALRQDIAALAQAQAPIAPPYALKQLNKLLGARLFTAAETLLAAKPERTAADDLLLCDIRYRHGDFAGAVALARDLTRRERELAPAEQDKLQRLLKNGSRRVSEEPAGRGALLWASRHPLLISVRERAQATDASEEDLSCLLDLSRFLGVGDLIRDAVSPQGYFVRDKLTAVFRHRAFLRPDLRSLLGAAAERSTRENHEVAAALITANRIELVPDVFA